jgi:ATP synthase protein I
MGERRTPPGVPSQARYVDRDDGWTLAAELLTATFLWGGIGWLLDRWLGTGPVLMAIGFVLGNALGVYLLWVRSHDRFTEDHQRLLARRARSTTRAMPPTPVHPYDEPPEPFPAFPRRERAATPTSDGTRRPAPPGDPVPEVDHG